MTPHSHYGFAFDKSTIDAAPLPSIPKHLLPWLKKDRKEAVEGVHHKDSTGQMIHDGSGLEKAEQDLRKVQTDLLAKGNSKDRQAILEMQKIGAEINVQFYQGKIYLLDKVIATTESSQGKSL